jgi:hypothetical protein
MLWLATSVPETIHTHQNECGDDQQEHKEHHDLGVLANKIKHALLLHQITKKGEH